MEFLIDGISSQLLVHPEDSFSAKEIPCRLNLESFSLLKPGEWSALPPNHAPEVLLLMASPSARITEQHLTHLRQLYPSVPIILLLDTPIIENLEDTLSLEADDFHDFVSGFKMLEARVKKWRPSTKNTSLRTELLQDETAIWRTLFELAGAGMLTGNPHKFLDNEPSFFQDTGDPSSEHWNAFIRHSLLQIEWEINNRKAAELLDLNEPVSVSIAFISKLEAMNPLQFGEDLRKLGSSETNNIEGDFEFTTNQGFHRRLTLTFKIPDNLEDIILVTITDITARVELETQMRNHLMELESMVQSRTRTIQRANKQLAEESKQRKRLAMQVRENLVNITQGIISAKSILDIALPSVNEIRATFPQSMLISRPRDIMGGDFIFTAEKDGKKLLSLIDSTGHGIPGAMVSMMGSSLINRSFATLLSPNPSNLLEQFHNEFLEKVNTNKGNPNLFGFDAGIIMIDESERLISFAGARGDLYMVRQGMVQIFRGTRTSIELNNYSDSKELHYNLHSAHLEPGDQLYMVTDGIRDQFGGERNRKLGRKRLADILAQYSHLGLVDREKAIQQALLLWKGPNAKVDDATLVGIEFPTTPQTAL